MYHNPFSVIPFQSNLLLVLMRLKCRSKDPDSARVQFHIVAQTVDGGGGGSPGGGGMQFAFLGSAIQSALVIQIKLMAELTE